MAAPGRPLRVAHVTATFPPYQGGAGTVCAQLASGLAARGHRAEVFTAARPPAAAGSEERDGATVHRLEPVLAIGNAPLIPALARLRGFDLVHLHYPFIFGAELLLMGRPGRARAPIVVSYHHRLIGEGARAPMFRAYEETWGRLVNRRADRICVLSRRHADTVPYLRRIARRRPERIAVLENGVDVEAFTPGSDEAGVRRSLGIPRDSKVAAFVATLDRAHFFKRLDLALEAVRLAGDPDLHLLVVGGGEWLDRFRRESEARGLGDRVHFAGPTGHDRLPGLLRAADLLLLTSDLEAFPLALTEAMACGLPTISTDPPGVAAVVDDGVTGLLAPRGDAAAVAGALRRLIEAGPGRRREMGAAGRRKAEERYAWPRLVERLERIYADVLGGHGGPRGGGVRSTPQLLTPDGG